MEPLLFLKKTSNGNDLTVSIFERVSNENDVTVTICYLVSNGNDVTVTVCGNDAHLCPLPRNRGYETAKQ
jgi:predicted neutral ceramidase superfamily lipid hydrolase